MKKIFSFLILSFPLVVYATSGACSDHGGVNCSEGAGANGQVICNDGWDGSTISYDSMFECNQQPNIATLCPQPIMAGCTEEFEYSNFQNLCSQEQSNASNNCQSAQTNAARSGNPNIPTCASLPYQPSFNACAQASICRRQIDLNKVAKTANDKCISDQVSKMEQESNLRLQRTQARIKQQQDDQLKQSNLDKTCVDSLATYNQDTHKCDCKNDYVYTNGKCKVIQNNSDKINNDLDAIYGHGFFDDMPTPVSSATVKNKTKVESLEKNINAKPSRLLSGFTIAQPTSTLQSEDKVISTSTVNNVEVPQVPKNIGRLNRFYHSFISLFKFF
jgi:hypothetical protein